MRLQKFLSQAGIASRRSAEQMILAGRVKVNGQVVDKLGTIIDPDKDQISVDGRPTKIASGHTYLVLNKPAGYITTKSDEHAAKTIYDLLPTKYQGLKYAGRLDKDTGGLLLFTDDGELIQKLTHPSFKHEKEYIVRATVNLDKTNYQQLAKGVQLDDGPARGQIKRISSHRFSLIIHEGRKRQVRRMCQAVGVNIDRLVRIRIGKMILGKLELGKYEIVEKKDII